MSKYLQPQNSICGETTMATNNCILVSVTRNVLEKRQKYFQTQPILTPTYTITVVISKTLHNEN
jgi:hypothetical protein